MDHFNSKHRSTTSLEYGSENSADMVCCSAPRAVGAGCSGPFAPGPLTPRQLEILQAIEQYIDGHGWPPSIRELCAVMHVTSTNGMSQALDALEKKGYLRRDADVARGLQIIIPSTRAVVLPGGARKTSGACCRHCGKVA